MPKTEGLNQGREVSYCNTCLEYPLKDALASDNGRAKCRLRQQLYAWDSRACMFYDPAGKTERDTRKPMVVQLYKRQQKTD